MSRAPSGPTGILIADDDAFVCELVRDILASSGYYVFSADCGAAALKIVRAHPDEIDLLITDSCMPDLTGHELAQQVVGLRPGVKVLYISGYGNDGGLANYLQKPFRPSTLEAKVREVLMGI